MRSLLILGLLLVVGPALAQEDPAPTDEPVAAETILDVLEADGRFTVLLGALQSTNLVETLSGAGPFTLFAPTDEAFASVPEGTLDVLTPEQLQAVLLYHVVGGGVDAATAAAAGEAPTAGGGALVFTASDTGLRVNEAAVTEADLAAANGVVHVIDAVLLPPVEEGAGDGM
jgi:uncharacterized surface protein with fasciclin (FAS1) repeats